MIPMFHVKELWLWVLSGKPQGCCHWFGHYMKGSSSAEWFGFPRGCLFIEAGVFGSSFTVSLQVPL